jgi:Protein of unknown function (DUF3467)
MAKPKAKSRITVSGAAVPGAPPANQIIVNSENIQPIYANSAQVATTNNDFRLIFLEVLDANPERSVLREWARVYMTPVIAKALLAVLAGGVEKYEKDNGPIRVPEMPTVKGQPS